MPSFQKKVGERYTEGTLQRLVDCPNDRARRHKSGRAQTRQTLRNTHSQSIETSQRFLASGIEDRDLLPTNGNVDVRAVAGVTEASTQQL